MLHVISAGCVARDLHKIAPGPLEHACIVKNLELHFSVRLLVLLLLLNITLSCVADTDTSASVVAAS